MPSFSPPPPGLTARPLRLDDAAVLVDLEAADRQAAVGVGVSVGVASNPREAVLARLTDPGFDPATDGCLALGPSGEPLGYAMVLGRGARFGLELVAREPAVLAWLLRHAVERAREIARGAGVAEVTVATGVRRDDHLLRTVAEQHGLVHTTTYQQMRIDHLDPVAEPAPPAGVTVRRGAPDEASRRTAHFVLTESFSGHEIRPYDEWMASREARSAFDWSMVTVLEQDGRAVAMRECSDSFVGSDGCGYIGRLGVVPAARGGGLAKFLLRDAFAQDSAAGRRGTILHVNANNPTPAVALYLSVGMRVTSALDSWERRLPTA